MICFHCKRNITKAQNLVTIHAQEDGSEKANSRQDRWVATGPCVRAYHRKCYKTETQRAGTRLAESRPGTYDQVSTNATDAALAQQARIQEAREAAPESDQRDREERDWREPVTLDVDQLVTEPSGQ